MLIDTIMSVIRLYSFLSFLILNFESLIGILGRRGATFFDIISFSSICSVRLKAASIFSVSFNPFDIAATKNITTIILIRFEYPRRGRRICMAVSSDKSCIFKCSKCSEFLFETRDKLIAHENSVHKPPVHLPAKGTKFSLKFRSNNEQFDKTINNEFLPIYIHTAYFSLCQACVASLRCIKPGNKTKKVHSYFQAVNV